MQKGNLEVDLVSTAWLDKGDYPHCGELGPLDSVSVYVCALICRVNVQMDLLCVYC